ncbi:hypothetical protein [Neobacillus sp.]|uniref:hypothetical protein n=1 Tax=Neobacillus sp. TaxID=2675273 RepID=UPI0035B520A0
MTTPTITPKSGIVEFRNQREIIIDRQMKTQEKYKALQNRIGKILLTNNYLVQQSINHKENE